MNKGRALFLIALIIFFINGKGTAMAESSEYEIETKGIFKQIDLLHGISKEEAIIIAQNYAIGQGWDEDYVISKPIIKDFKNKLYRTEEWEITFNATYRANVKQAKGFGAVGLFRGYAWVNVDKKTGVIRAGTTPFDL